MTLFNLSSVLPLVQIIVFYVQLGMIPIPLFWMLELAKVIETVIHTVHYIISLYCFIVLVKILRFEK